MNRSMTLCLVAMLCCGMAATAGAVPMSGEYSIAASATQIDQDSWRFEYLVTNNTQQGDYSRTGLDGFYLQVPISAVITGVTNPNPYWGSPGWWENGNSGTGQNFWAPEATTTTDYRWYYWWGQDPASVYPEGSTARFTITLDHVMPGRNDGVAVTYWAFPEEPLTDFYTITEHGHYSGYSSNFLAPVAYEPEPVPEPATLVLLGSGLLGLVGRRFRKKR